MANKSTFGAGPEGIDRLLAMYLEEFDSDEDSSATTRKDQLLERPGTRIGRYKLLRVLGEGGMGIVYLAEQAEPIERIMALKVIKPGMDSARVIARFEAERQVLALLDHPNIAHVYDAGTTDAGRPYFVMEYVQGLPITKHCDHHKLSIDDRLKLFLQICHAVHHAHQKGIIHRDIKPSNILVSTVDNQAIPKIIDFGVAKALSRTLTEETVFTEQGRLFGTPEYMSPEQADLANEDVDIRSDVYSLGVLLYVLITGVLPFDSEALRKGGIDHIRHMICEADPKTPSTRLTGLGEEAQKVAQSRRTEIATLAKKLHKELEWIPLKAMRKERLERYRSAAELADDIEHYLEGRPLIAGPPGTMYQLKKLVHRHQALVAGLVTLLVVLLLGIVVSTLFAFKADRALAEAQAVSDFLQTSVIRSLSPYYVGGRIITSRSVLDNASEDLEDKLADKPLAEASIRQTLAVAYWSLGLFEQAELHLRRALEIRQAKLGTKHPDTLETMKNLGWTVYYQSRYDEAEQLLAKAVQGMEPVVDEGHWNSLSAKAMLAAVYYMQGRFEEGEQLHSKVVETVIRVLGEEHAYSPIFMNGLAWGYYLQGRYVEAEQMVIKAREISRRVFGELHWETLVVMHNFGELRRAQGHYDKAEQLLLTVLEDRRDALGEEHCDTLWAMISLGRLYKSWGQYKQAESLFAEAMETSQAVLGNSHICSLHSKSGLGDLYISQGRYDKAEPLLEEAVAIMRRALGEKNWITLNGMNVLARLYMAQSRYDEAEHLFVEALKGRSRVMGNDHPDTLETKNDMAILYKKQGDYDKAESLFIEAIEGRRLKLGDTHPHTKESLENLIALYEAWNKPEKSQRVAGKTGTN